MKRRYIVLLHTFYWFLSFVWTELAETLFTTGHHFDWGKFITPFWIGEFIVFMLPFYINYFIVMPRYFKQGKMLQTWLSWLALLVFFICFRYLIQEVVVNKLFDSPNYAEGTSKVFYAFDNVYFGTRTLLMSIFIWATVNWKKLENEKNTLAKEKVSAELNFLKSQVNPHFLFNTLNNIYSLVYHKSEKALPAIMQLSELMRYMTTEAPGDKIELSKEIQYIESFIALESLRVRDEVAIEFSVTGVVPGMSIAPLILIPFIENGFKHGVITDKATPFVINIAVNKNELHLLVSNKVNYNQKDAASGIGLSNVRRRLDILYTGNYTLETDKKDDAYICNLSIKL